MLDLFQRTSPREWFAFEIFTFLLVCIFLKNCQGSICSYQLYLSMLGRLVFNAQEQIPSNCSFLFLKSQLHSPWSPRAEEAQLYSYKYVQAEQLGFFCIASSLLLTLLFAVLTAVLFYTQFY